MPFSSLIDGVIKISKKHMFPHLKQVLPEIPAPDIGNLLPDYSVLQHKILQLKCSTTWEPQIPIILHTWRINTLSVLILNVAKQIIRDSWRQV